MAYLLIDPGETLDYSFDWSEFLDEGGSPSDAIVTSSWAVTPQAGSPPAPTLSGQANNLRATSVFVSDATLGAIYQLTNTIATAAGRTAERSITLRCENR